MACHRDGIRSSLAHAHVFAPGHPSDRSSIAETVEGVDFQWLWAAAYHTNNWRRAWNWLTFWYGVRRARRGLVAPAIVLGSSPQLFAAHAARFLARRFGVPFVFEVRDLWPESLLAAGGKRGIAHWLLDRLARSLYRDADRILVLAKGAQDYLVARGLPADKFIYVPNGVDIHAVARRRRHEGPKGRSSFFMPVHTAQQTVWIGYSMSPKSYDR